MCGRTCQRRPKSSRPRCRSLRTRRRPRSSQDRRSPGPAHSSPRTLVSGPPRLHPLPPCRVPSSRSLRRDRPRSKGWPSRAYERLLAQLRRQWWLLLGLHYRQRMSTSLSGPWPAGHGSARKTSSSTSSRSWPQARTLPSWLRSHRMRGRASLAAGRRPHRRIKPPQTHGRPARNPSVGPSRKRPKNATLGSTGSQAQAPSSDRLHAVTPPPSQCPDPCVLLSLQSQGRFLQP